MDIYTSLFTSKKINEGNNITPKKRKPLLHETTISTIDLPYAPMTSPSNKNNNNKNKNNNNKNNNNKKTSLFPAVH